MSETYDAGTQAFVATRNGAEVEALTKNPTVIAEMKLIAGHGLSPIRVLEKYLSDEARRGLGGVWENSRCGRLVRINSMGDTHVPSGDREKLKGPTFGSGALYMPRP